MAMARPMIFTDEALMHAIEADRRELGACTITSLSFRLGVSRSAAQQRVQDLLREGLVTRSQLAGSLRLITGDE
jgi:predicted transcriptional regulator